MIDKVFTPTLYIISSQPFYPARASTRLQAVRSGNMLFGLGERESLKPWMPEATQKRDNSLADNKVDILDPMMIDSRGLTLGERVICFG